MKLKDIFEKPISGEWGGKSWRRRKGFKSYKNHKFY